MNVSIADFGRTSCAVKKLVNSIKRLIAVLNRSASMSSVTAATVRATTFACSGVNGDILDLGVEPDDVGLGIDDHPPGPAEEAIDALHALHAPGLDRFQRAHEHLVEPQAIGAVFLDDRRRD